MAEGRADSQNSAAGSQRKQENRSRRAQPRADAMIYKREEGRSRVITLREQGRRGGGQRKEQRKNIDGRHTPTPMKAMAGARLLKRYQRRHRPKGRKCSHKLAEAMYKSIIGLRLLPAGDGRRRPDDGRVIRRRKK